MRRSLLLLAISAVQIVHCATCPPQNLTSPLAKQYLGVFGWATAASNTGGIVVVSAPGEQRQPNGTMGDIFFFLGRGNVYPYTASAYRARSSPVDTSAAGSYSSSAAADSDISSASGPTSTPKPLTKRQDSCTYKALPALERPPVANGKAQGFGMGLALTADGSSLLTAVGGCYVPAGGLPSPCPDFPGSAATPAIVPPDDSSTNTGASSNSLAGTSDTVHSEKEVHDDRLAAQREVQSTTSDEDDFAVTEEMDLIWLYKKVGTGSKQRFVLDKKASGQLTMLGPNVQKQSSISWYSTPIVAWLSMSDAGSVIAANILMGHMQRENQYTAITFPTGVQVFRKATPLSNWRKVLYLKNITADGEPCTQNATDCYLTYPREASISSDGRLLATAWYTNVRRNPQDIAVTLHMWNSRTGTYVFGDMVIYNNTDTATVPSFSPDGSVLAIGYVKSSEWVITGQYVDFYGIQMTSSQGSAQRQGLTAQLVCTLKVPGQVGQGHGALSGVKLFRGSEPNTLLLGLTLEEDPTLIYTVPTKLTRPSARSKPILQITGCPHPETPTYSVPRPEQPDGRNYVMWGSRYTQSFTATKLVAGMPTADGSVPVNSSRPVWDAGAVLVANYDQD